MKEMKPDNLRVDFAVSREQTNEKGEKMYIQTRMAQYDRELWELLKKDNTFVYMCGLKGMEKGIDDIMVSLAAEDGKKNAYNLSSNFCLGDVDMIFYLLFFFCKGGVTWIPSVTLFSCFLIYNLTLCF